jgi:predicted Zn-dependent protease
LNAADLAAAALEAVTEGDGALAAVTRERSLMLRYARSRPTQSTAIDDVDVEITVLADGHTGAAHTNRTDAGSLAACARSAAAAARAAAKNGPGGYPGFPGPAPLREHEGHDPATAQLHPEPGGAAMACAFEVAEARGVEAHGIWTTAEIETALCSSTGQTASERVTDAFMKVTAIAPGGRSGYASQTAVAAGALDARALAERAVGKAASAGEPAELPAGEYPVVFERHAVAELCNWLGWLALNGLAYAEERSALNGRLGTLVAAARVNLSDSPRFPRTLPRAFDAEGVPKAPIPLIQDGVAKGLVHDTRSAALVEGATTTGHALAAGGSSYGPSPTNLVLVGGGGADEDELCLPVERGVYVTRLWYVNAVRPKETLITGMTRDGTFLIEDGRVTRPLHDMRLTDSVLGILERTEELGARALLTSDAEFYGRRFACGVVCPPLRASRVRFTAG